MRHFFQRGAEAYGLAAPPSVEPAALEAIHRYSWPGNVRQLRSLCERWVIVASGRPVTLDMLPADMRDAPPPRPGEGLAVDVEIPLKTAVDRVVQQLERDYLDQVLQRHDGHISHAAAAAGITRRTLYTKMKAYRLDAEDYRQ